MATTLPPPSETMQQRQRCAWAGSGGDSDLMVRYHDEEWGVPSHDDRHLFEMLILEGAQAGLSWQTVLRRRDGYRRAFASFDITRIAAFGEADRERLLADSGIIRNRAKLDATIGNARAALELIAEYGSLDAFFWEFNGGVPLQRRPATEADVRASSPESLALSKELGRRGFRFTGPTIMYAFMQACGLVNDHVETCFRSRELGG